MKQAKKVLSAVLAAVMLIGCVSMGVSAQDNTTDKDVSAYPIIYMTGSWGNLYRIENGVQTELMFGTTTELAQAFSDVMDDLLANLTSLNFSGVVDIAIDLVQDLFEPIRMDGNGDSINKDVGRIAENYQIIGNYTFYNFDWRLDPMVLADDLDAYIEWFLGATGAEKVNIQCLSGSAQVLMCYYALHGHKNRLASAVFGISLQNGSETFGGAAKRELVIDADNLGRAKVLAAFDTEIPLGEIANWLPWLYEPGLLTLVSKLLQLGLDSEVDRLYDEALVPTLLSMPGIWAYVPKEDYEKALRVNFKGDSQYDGLVQRMNVYRENVMYRQDELMREMSGKIKVAIRAGYGKPLLPITKNSYVQADSMVDTARASFGATCAPLDYPFLKTYKQKINTGEGNNHISPDRMIDASTCLLPLQTWFARDQAHGPEYQYSGWYNWFLRTDEVSVFANEAYPQFTQCISKGVYEPLEPVERTAKDSFLMVFRWIMKAYRFIIMLPWFWVDLVT